MNVITRYLNKYPGRMARQFVKKNNVIDSIINIEYVVKASRIPYTSFGSAYDIQYITGRNYVEMTIQFNLAKANSEDINELFSFGNNVELTFEYNRMTYTIRDYNVKKREIVFCMDEAHSNMIIQLIASEISVVLGGV
jgi:hypothetical protein